MRIELDNIEQAAAIRDAVSEWLVMADASATPSGGWDSESMDALTSGLDLLTRAIRREVVERGGY